MHAPKPSQTELDWNTAPPVAVDLEEAAASAAALAAPFDAALTGAIAFASPEAQLQRTAELLGDGALVVAVPPLPATMRGQLADHLEEHLERELATRGAPSPYLAAWSAMPDDAEERLADQLFRARTLGASGIALAMGSLAAAAYPALTPEDSATLRWLARASTHAPLVVLLDDADTFAAAYEAPVSLPALLARASASEPAIAPGAGGADARPIAPEDEAVDEPSSPSTGLGAAFDGHGDAADLSPTKNDTRVAPVEVEVEVEAEPEMPPPERCRPRVRDRATIGVPVAGPDDFWRSWALALGAVRGPLPLGAFERLFAESYVPLANAIACGLDDPRALRAHDEFRRTFERAYTDAFATFGATNRRPRLVMDAYDVASKQARLHGARTAQVLLVDSMRWDVGALFRDALGVKASGSASLTSETVLWSALPTTTIRQLETVARGMDALRAPSGEEPQESLRGRSAEVVRRLRVGSRELHKLDLVPAMLGAMGDEPGAQQVVGALERVADAVAESVARHIETLPPRTLVLVLGDHGFTVDRRGRILHGGASPEEVLMPAYCWLTGDLH